MSPKTHVLQLGRRWLVEMEIIQLLTSGGRKVFV